MSSAKEGERREEREDEMMVTKCEFSVFIAFFSLVKYQKKLGLREKKLLKKII